MGVVTQNYCKQLWMWVAVCLLYISNVYTEKTLSSPRVTDWGKWGLWEYCPAGTFVTGMQLYTHPSQGVFRDDRGLTGVRLFCNPYSKRNGNLSIKSSIDDVGKWGKQYFCNGLMTGFQLRSETYQTFFIDDTAANNLRMFCDGSENLFQQGDGNSYGSWTAKQVCGLNEAVCGITTQLDNSNSWDKTGLNNVMMKCCDIPHPVKYCTPRIDWKLVSTCNNLHTDLSQQIDDSIKCSYVRNVGISYADGLQIETKRLYEKMGYGLTTAASIYFQSKFLNHSDQFRNSKNENDHYWLTSPSYVWDPQISQKAFISAKQNYNVSVYQIHGKCGAFQVWGTKLKQVEYFLDANNASHETVRLVDFTNDNLDVDY